MVRHTLRQNVIAALVSAVPPLLAGLRLSAVLTLIALGFTVYSGLPPGMVLSVWFVIELVFGTLALLLPFGAFGAGIAGAALGRTRAGLVSVFIAAATLGLLTYALAEFVSPTAEYASDVRSGLDIEALKPFGPQTPRAMARHRAYIEANPPSTFSYSTDRPFNRPVSWIDYQVHVSIAHCVFALINGMIGFVAGLLAFRSPVRRRMALWAIGLLGGIGLMMVMSGVGTWLRSNPLASGVSAAWMPLVLPLMELAVLHAVVSRTHRHLHAEGTRRV